MPGHDECQSVQYPNARSTLLVSLDADVQAGCWARHRYIFAHVLHACRGSGSRQRITAVWLKLWCRYCSVRAAEYNSSEGKACRDFILPIHEFPLSSQRKHISPSNLINEIMTMDSGIIRVYASALFSSSLVLVVLGVSAVYIAYRMAYDVYFHPLAECPGPLLGCITQLYDVYHAYIGDKHISFHLLHEKHGNGPIRFSPNSLSINDPVALKAIYSRSANVQKSDFYVGFRAASGAISTLLATEKVHHARKRRIIGQAFSDHAMKGLETYVLENVRARVDKLEAGAEVAKARETKWGAELDMGKLNNYLAFGVFDYAGLLPSFAG
jgi:hypothetical protein